MFIPVLFSLLVATAFSADGARKTIFESGSFAKDLVETRLKESMMHFAFSSVPCVSSFAIVASEEATATVQVIEGHENGVYRWSTVGTASVSATSQEILLESVCTSRWKVILTSGTFNAVSVTLVEEERSKKRIGCPFVATNQWPKECKTAAEGPHCLTTGICGCIEDADCYSDTTHPFCNVATNVCVKCTGLTGGAVNWGYSCRSRYPSRFYVDQTLTTGSTTPGQFQISNTASEEIPLNGFYKEICVTGGATTGGCDRCDQANAANIPANMLTFPDYSSASTPDGTLALSGSYFCGQVRGASSPTPTRPICIMAGLFGEVGMSAVWNTLQVSLEVANYGSFIGGSDPPKAATVTQTLDLFEGSCGPCSVLDPTGTTPVLLHGICLKVLNTAPICDSDPTVGCRKCGANPDCKLATSMCATDGTGSCTGGNNCQADGSCFTCTKDSDCGLLDGGETPGQSQCDTMLGQCVTPLPCSDNFGTMGTNPCSMSKPNCNMDGSCIQCLTDKDCGGTDGGGTPSQTVCYPSGICGFCDDNNGGTVGVSACPTTALPNCNQDGSCIKCLTDKDCGGTDGGPVPKQPLCLPATGVCDSCGDNFGGTGPTPCPTMALPNCNQGGLCISCLTNGDCGSTDGGLVLNQPVCAVSQHVCISACNDNYLGSASSPCPTMAFPNCNLDGTCVKCLSDADCGKTDGGQKTNQPICDVTNGVCINACTVNYGVVGTSPCATAALPNCNVNGFCIHCNTNTDCGVTDGGLTPGQQVCNPLGYCVGCTVNADCVGTGGANCQVSGLCIDCTTNPANICTLAADGGQPAAGPCVATGNGYCPDMNGQTICNTATKLCESPCLGNGWCADKLASGVKGFNDGLNCQLDGTCVSCQTPGPTAIPIPNAPLCGKLDGPGKLPGARGKPNQPECQVTGICSDAVGPSKKFQPGPPTALFRSGFNNPQGSYLALIEFDRQNNIKGTVEPVNGTGFGPFPPHIFVHPEPYSYSYLNFIPMPIPCVAASGGGVVEWSTFRLDHNTVFNDGAQAVEDNLWVFSWRHEIYASMALSASCTSYYGGFYGEPLHDLANSPWTAIMSFPAFSNPTSNMAITIRSRLGFDELAIFIGADPTLLQINGYQVDPTQTTYPAPVAAWKLPHVVPNNPASYIMSIPQPDRTPYPTLDISFRASPGDFISTASAADIATWLDSVVEELVANYLDNLSVPTTWPPSTFMFNITRANFYYPNGTVPVGNYSATYYLQDPVENALVLQVLELGVADTILAFLTTPASDDVLNPAQDLANNIEVVHFTSISVNHRTPGGIPLNSCHLWIDGVLQPLADITFEPSIYSTTVANDPALLGAVDWSILFPGQNIKTEEGNTAISASIDINSPMVGYGTSMFQECATGTFTRVNEVKSLIVGTAVAPNWLSASNFYVGSFVDVVPDDIGLGGWSSCTINIKIVPLSSNSYIPGPIVYNSDKTPNSPGPFLVLGGIPTVVANDGFESYVALLSGMQLWDVNVYSVAAADASIYTLDESFLRTLVSCGDGDVDPPEQCDSADPSCLSDCTCPLRTVPLPPIGCTVCGNGIRDWEAFNVRKDATTEVCEYTLDPMCKQDCTGCIDAGMFVDQTLGLCTFCGNGHLDSGEACDYKIDMNCSTDCKSCLAGKLPTGFGGCFLCGNGVFDAGEVCDDPVNFCSSDCSSCAPGYVPDGLGSCTKCGNGVIDAGEICDPALTSCVNCKSCDENHVPGANGCTRCGNGALDAGEICDTAYPNCLPDCTACNPGTVPAGDKLGSCTLCGNGVLDQGENCDVDANCVDCADCREPFVLVPGGRCLLCGNGLLDDGEVCDSLHTDSCASACQACLPDFEPNLDPVANPTGRCFPTSCANAPTTDASQCNCK